MSNLNSQVRETIKHEKVASGSFAVFALVVPLGISVLVMGEFTKAKIFFALSALALGVILLSLASRISRPRWKITAYIASFLAASAFYFWLWFWVREREAKATNTAVEISGIPYWLMRLIVNVHGLPWLWILSCVAVGAVAAILLGSVIRKRRRLIEDAKPRVQILTPPKGEEVGWHRIVRGSVYPPDSEVQVLIRPPDGWWYLQKAPSEVRGQAWSYKCEFGEKQITGHPYDVVAVHGTSLTDDRYRNLPESLVKSAAITLNRRPLDDFIDCPDKRLHQTKIDDKSMIKDMVKVFGVNCEIQLEGDSPFVGFVFCFLNLSLLPISIESVTGLITYQKDACGDSIEFEYKPKLTDKDRALNRGFRDTGGWFRIRQYLAPYEVQPIANGSKESVFYFHKLNMWITGDGFAPVRLDVDRVQKGISWVARMTTNECDFVYASIAETKAKFLELETERDSLKSQLDELRGT